jgi:DNA invertase Pin-like site-specific DNA recombinase
MIYVCARVSTDAQDPIEPACPTPGSRLQKVFSEVASGAKIERVQLRRLLNQLDARDVPSVTLLDRLARSTPKASTFITQAHDYVISQYHRFLAPSAVVGDFYR